MSKSGIKNVILSEVYIKNSNTNGANKTYTFKNSELKAISKTITHSTDHVFGFKIGLTVGGKVGVPFVAEGSVEVSTETSYQMSKMSSSATAWTDTHGVEWWESGNLTPGRAVHCKSTAYTGEFDDDYVATVEVKTANGQKFTIEQEGNFKSVGWTEAVSECKDIPLEDAPGSAFEADDDDDDDVVQHIDPDEEEPVLEKRARQFRA